MIEGKALSSLPSCICFLCLPMGFLSLVSNSSHTLSVPGVPTGRQQDVGTKKSWGQGLAQDYGMFFWFADSPQKCCNHKRHRQSWSSPQALTAPSACSHKTRSLDPNSWGSFSQPLHQRKSECSRDLQDQEMVGWLPREFHPLRRQWEEEVGELGLELTWVGLGSQQVPDHPQASVPSFVKWG